MMSIIKNCLLFLIVITGLISCELDDGCLTYINDNYYLDECESSRLNALFYISEEDSTLQDKLLEIRNSIYPTVVECKYNEKFIVVKQIPRYKLYEVFLISELQHISGLEKAKKLADSLLTNDPYFLKVFADSCNYWIIPLDENKKLGPFSKNEFVENYIKLKLPEELKLN